MTGGLKITEQIQILLAEYSMLGAEIIQRTTWKFQLMAAAAAGVAIVGSTFLAGAIYTGVFFLSIVVVFFCTAILFIRRETREVVDAIVKLERSINELAGQGLLSWETQKVLSAMGHAVRWRRFLTCS